MTTEPTHDGLALPIDHGARRGAGVRVGVSLGGGGIYFIAWQVAYLHELARAGIDLARSDRLVGTSAGSVVSSMLAAGTLERLHAEVRAMSSAPALIGALVAAGDLSPSRARARDLFGAATDAEPPTVRAIGHAALAATAPSPLRTVAILTAVMGRRRWPSPSLHLTCVDAHSGERCVVTHASGVPVARAAAASAAVPGIFAPQRILDRRCMDGGVSGTGTHLDLLSGAGRAVVLSLTDGSALDEGLMTVAPGSVEAEFDLLRASGTRLWVRSPAPVGLEELMSPDSVPAALDDGRTTARRDAPALARFLDDG